MLGAIAVVVFGWLVTGGTGRFFAPEPLGAFYDYQAESLLHGRLDVPPEAISFEAFVFEGKTYGYFGVTPALLRVPFVLLDVGFGRLSRGLMVFYFTACLVAGYLLVLHARRLAGITAPPRVAGVALFVANAGLGGTLFFLGARAYVYHEAILCGAAFGLWSVWFSLRQLAAPHGRWWIGAVVCGTLAVHARPPIGLFALTLSVIVAAALGISRWREAHAHGQGAGLWWRQFRLPLMVVLLSVAGVLSFNGVSFLKFRTFNGWPLQYHVQYQESFAPGRLARFGGRPFHLVNFPFDADTYLWRPNFTLSPYLPYLRMGTPVAARYPGAKLDWVEPTLAFPYAMPGLLALAGFGCAGAFRFSRGVRAAIGVLAIAAVPLGAAMFTTVAVSHRYTADFCPLFIAAAAIGVGGWSTLAPRTHPVLYGAAGALTALGLAGNLLLALDFQGERAWGVADDVRANYANLRRRMDGFFGLQNPRGYDTARLPCRAVDVSFETWIVITLLQRPDMQDRAFARYERELARQTYDADVHFQVADAYAAHGELDKAVRAMTRGLAAKPREPAKEARLGMLLARAGRTGEAVTHYRTALEQQPGLASAHNNLGIAYAKLGQLEAALREVETAHTLDPNDAEATKNLAILRAAMEGDAKGK